VFDWTDPKHPREIAFFDRGPVDSTRMAMVDRGPRSWYNGNIVSSEIGAWSGHLPAPSERVPFAE